MGNAQTLGSSYSPGLNNPPNPFPVVNPAPYTYGFPFLHRALGKVRSGNGDSKCLLLGDSTTFGYGGSHDGFGTAMWLSAILNIQTIPAAPGLVVPNGPGLPGADARWAVGAGWSQAAGTTWAWGGTGPYYDGAVGAAANTLTFTPNTPLNQNQYDRFDIYYLMSAGTGGFTADIDGGAGTVINTANASPQIGMTTINAAAASSAHVVEMGSVTTNAVLIIGVEPWLSTTSRLRIANAGVGAATTASWSSATANTGIGPLNCISKYAPDVTIISLGVNDAGTLSLSVSQYLTNLLTIVKQCQLSGDVIIESPNPSENNGAFAAYAQEANYTAALPAFAVANNCAYIPWFERMGGVNAYSKLNPLGYYFDFIHGTDQSYADRAASEALALLQT